MISPSIRRWKMKQEKENEHCVLETNCQVSFSWLFFFKSFLVFFFESFLAFQWPLWKVCVFLGFWIFSWLWDICLCLTSNFFTLFFCPSTWEDISSMHQAHSWSIGQDLCIPPCVYHAPCIPHKPHVTQATIVTLWQSVPSFQYWRYDTAN